MNEFQALLAAAAELRAARRRALLATIVRTRGSTYRRPGARLLLDENGWRAGTVSGGCLEAELLESAWQRVTANGGRPVALEYDTVRDGDLLWGHGSGCGGAATVLLEFLPPEAPADVLTFLADCRARRQGAAVMTVVRSDDEELPVGERLGLAADGRAELGNHRRLLPGARAALRAQRSRSVALDGAGEDAVEAFAEYVPPPPALVIFGTGHDAVPVVRLARSLGWRVTVGGRRGTHGAAQTLAALADDFQSAAAVAEAVQADTLALVMTHHYLEDLSLLQTLIQRAPRYLGLLGPAARRDRLLRDLRKLMPAATALPLPRLHAPAGLDLGAESPEEIALSIVAEMQAVLAGRVGGSLCVSQQPIHPPAAETRALDEPEECGSAAA
ncbi:MAG: XdhC family protein [Verrucomicrobia bacterium]|nr:XdhC family protein [Verrucomicrobiota bacterium]